MTGTMSLPTTEGTGSVPTVSPSPMASKAIAPSPVPSPMPVDTLPPVATVTAVVPSTPASPLGAGARLDLAVVGVAVALLVSGLLLTWRRRR